MRDECRRGSFRGNFAGERYSERRRETKKEEVLALYERKEYLLKVDLREKNLEKEPIRKSQYEGARDCR